MPLRTLKKHLLFTLMIAVPLSGCTNALEKLSSLPHASKVDKTDISPAKIQAEDARLVAFLDATFEESVKLYPEFATYLGRKDGYDSWNDRSEAAADLARANTQKNLAALKASFDRENLSAEGKLNYDLFVHSEEEDLALDDFRKHRYVLSQFRGVHSQIPVTLANYHKIETVQDAKDYIARVSKVDDVLDQAATEIEARARAGYTLPEFSYPLIVASAQNVRNGAPFTRDGTSPIWADWQKKIAKLDADNGLKKQLTEELKAALLGDVNNGYRDFEKRMASVGSGVRGNYGVGGENKKAYYNALLKSYTSTDMTADEVHDLGVSEVARIQEEMKGIMKKVAFKGDLQEFFEFMRTDKQFYYANTDEGRAKYLAAANRYIDNVRPKIPGLFITLPKAPVEVRRVEEFRERASGKAFYNQPAADGSRPGIFYANLLNMEDMPTYQLEALVYHEAIPGHHMQRAIQVEMTGLPKTRQYGGSTAYTEGWGLYSEYLGKELGFYEDPYSDFGRLAMELWRAARLVVDTGLHSKGWEMGTAIAYLEQNTPNPKGDCQKAIERYIVYPGQATAYKIGMNKLLALRAKTKDALGEDFSIAEFHDVILTGGPMPLAILERRLEEYVTTKKAELL